MFKEDQEKEEEEEDLGILKGFEFYRDLSINEFIVQQQIKIGKQCYGISLELIFLYEVNKDELVIRCVIYIFEMRFEGQVFSGCMDNCVVLQIV